MKSLNSTGIELPAFNKDHFLSQFNGAFKQMNAAVSLAQKLANKEIFKIIFVGCGAPHHLFMNLQYWASKFSLNTHFFRYFPAEFVHHDASSLDEYSLVILGSHSGTTKETVEAANYVKSTPAVSIAITQGADSLLGKAVDHTICYGATEQGYFSTYILAQIFLSAFLELQETGWKLHKALMQSLPNLPTALADAKEQGLKNVSNHAEELMDEQMLYVLGSGSMYTTAYVFATCFLMEMQWMHAHPLQAAEFFHGPFEVVDETTPLLILLGEDPSRPIAERALQFSRLHSEKTIVYDSKDFPMTGIDPSIRPLVAPLIVDSALTNLVEMLAVLQDHPMTKRRYMGVIEY